MWLTAVITSRWSDSVRHDLTYSASSCFHKRCQCSIRRWAPRLKGLNSSSLSFLLCSRFLSSPIQCLHLWHLWPPHTSVSLLSPSPDKPLLWSFSHWISLFCHGLATVTRHECVNITSGRTGNRIENRDLWNTSTSYPHTNNPFDISQLSSGTSLFLSFWRWMSSMTTLFQSPFYKNA